MRPVKRLLWARWADMAKTSPTVRATLLLVSVAFLVVFLSTAVKGVYQVYFVSLAEHFGQGRAQFAWSGSVFMLVTGLAAPGVGALSDRFGPLRTAAIGAVVAGLGFLAAASWSESLWVFSASFGLLGAFGLAAMSYVPMGVLVDRLFQTRHKGLAYAVVTNGTAIGFIVLSPLWVWLQPQLPWTSVFLWLGWAFGVPLAIAIALVARLEPPRAAAPAEAASSVSTWRLVRTDPVFYVLAFGFLGCGATMAFIDVHLLAHWEGQGSTRLAMAYGLSVLGVLELLSGLAAGTLALRFDKHRLLAGFYALRSLAMLLLLVPGLGVLPFAICFGASYLGTVILTSMFCFERYGAGIKGQVFGALFLIHQLGAFAAVQLGALSFERTGRYGETIAALAALTIAGALASWWGLAERGRSVPDSRFA